jgi:hypothetical protein
MLLAIVSVGALANERLPTLAPGTLRIGTYFVNPPFEYISKGARVGFEVDLMNEIGRVKVYPFDRIEEAWPSSVVRLSRTMADKTGGYDHIVSTRRVSDERELVPTVVLGDVGS